MRLRPRVGSSDVEDAREIARRLDQRGQPAAGPAPAGAGYVRFGEPEGRPTPASEPEAQDAEPLEPTTEAPEETSASTIDAESDAVPEVETESDLVRDVEAESDHGDADAEGLAESETSESAEASPVPEPVDAIITMPPGPASDGPSWDTLLLTSQALTGAQAGMLIGPDGALLASSGEWPAVGAAAIAAKLLPLVAARLAAGGMVPVKMAGQSLTAWNLEVDAATLTVAFLADQALDPGLRLEIDMQLAQGHYSG